MSGLRESDSEVLPQKYSKKQADRKVGKTRLPLNVKVNSLDGPCGRTTDLILTPTNGEITHEVIEYGSCSEPGYLVPIDRIVESTPETLHLNCSLVE